MKKTKTKLRRIGILSVLIVLAISLRAQAPATPKAPAPAPTSIQSAQSTSADAGSPGPASTNPAAKRHGSKFVIGNGDVLAINVWKQPQISASVPVRSDGRISLPLVGQIQAAGRTPLQLGRAITDRLRKYITDPIVAVIVEQINSKQFNILGQVQKPGAYPLTRSLTVLDAIATAGGFRDFANKKHIYILRKKPDGQETRMKFNYKQVIKGKDAAQNIVLEPNDTVVVP